MERRLAGQGGRREAVTGVQEQDPVAGLKQSGGCEKGMGSGWTYGEGRDSGECEKGEGVQGQLWVS